MVHDLGSAEPRSRVEPSSRCIPLHQLELGSADDVQLNRRGYTVDDADWSSHARSKFDRRSNGGSELNRDQRLNRVGATPVTAELGLESNLTR